ncbi:hypothetical protein RS84_00239 [Microbacterium hydrocarbonoxydans]|uniref:Uncharacterized protein n=1 Tax=Microbacterium hydrocarbonoxydans TaxID=273678 RepID=A0A0M2HS47_9MICO|nr:hypothetical protein [Microbacterium hydrocarbonoxydans]KJL49526.1 hypothetical protein RS84_00239 [Microbacterium hydrocarbonoxydans]
MNRFEAAGLFVEAAKGKRVIVLTERRWEIGDAIRCFVEHPDISAWPGFRVCRRNGEERVDLGGRGRIVFHSAASNLRGLSADIVLVSEDAYRAMNDGRREEFLRDARAIVSASGCPEVVTDRGTRLS